jgi:hypothetical protein
MTPKWEYTLTSLPRTARPPERSAPDAERPTHHLDGMAPRGEIRPVIDHVVYPLADAVSRPGELRAPRGVHREVHRWNGVGHGEQRVRGEEGETIGST